MEINREKLAMIAPDLSKSFPRSPRERLGGFVVAARMLDKCRALLNGTIGEYKFDGALDRMLLEFVRISAEEVKGFVATGASDAEFAGWLQDRSRVKDEAEIVGWNNRMRYTRPVDLAIDRQIFLEHYIDQHVPRNRVVNYWFDVYDLEEQRI